jgi:hypothetical protein
MSLTQFLEAHGLFEIFGRLERQCMRISETTLIMRLHGEVQESIGAGAQLVRGHVAIQAARVAIVGWLFDTTLKFIFVQNPVRPCKFLI